MMIHTYEFKVLIFILIYFTYFAIPLSRVSKTFVLFSFEIDIMTILLYFAKSCSSGRTLILFLIDVSSGIVLFVY